MAHIALGSNLGDRRRLIASALESLHNHVNVLVTAVSDIIETDPVGPSGQRKYLNAAATLRTDLGPRDLLAVMLTIERRLGRDRRREPRNGPRMIDLDLLFYDDVVIDEPGLTVPHPRLHDRRFVLEPMNMIAPDLVHPVLRLTVHAMLSVLNCRESAVAGAGQSIGRVCRDDCEGA